MIMSLALAIEYFIMAIFFSYISLQFYKSHDGELRKIMIAKNISLALFFLFSSISRTVEYEGISLELVDTIRVFLTIIIGSSIVWWAVYLRKIEQENKNQTGGINAKLL